MNQCGLATGLFLNAQKTVNVCVANYPESSVRDRFDELGIDLGGVQISANGNHLGVFLGRGGGGLSWGIP
eukprot:9486253-Pyramimonas_sp.AAC.1